LHCATLCVRKVALTYERYEDGRPHMTLTPQDSTADARRIGAQLADELHLTLLARGFYVPMRAGSPVGGRAYVDVDPIRGDLASTMIEALGPVPLSAVMSRDPGKEAEVALRELRWALWGAGVRLPAMALGGGGEAAVVVELGAVGPETARRLARVVEAGTGKAGPVEAGAGEVGAEAEEEAPRVGELVHDTSRDLVAEFRGAVGGRWFLRPVLGGREWEALPADVRVAGTYERLRAESMRANAQSRSVRR
jgi:hypothetical protein